MRAGMAEILATRQFSEAKKMASQGHVNTSVSLVIEALHELLAGGLRAAEFRSVLIGGYARIGKTILASRLAESHGFVHISADILRQFFWHIDDDNLR